MFDCLKYAKYSIKILVYFGSPIKPMKMLHFNYTKCFTYGYNSRLVLLNNEIFQRNFVFLSDFCRRKML